MLDASIPLPSYIVLYLNDTPVIESLETTQFKYNTENSTYTLTFQIPETLLGCKLIVKTDTDVKMLDITSTQETVIIEGTRFDKAMVWDSLSGMAVRAFCYYG